MVAQWNSLVKLTTRYQEKVTFFVKKQKIGVRQHQNAGVSQNWRKISLSSLTVLKESSHITGTNPNSKP